MLQVWRLYNGSNKAFKPVNQEEKKVFIELIEKHLKSIENQPLYQHYAVQITNKYVGYTEVIPIQEFVNRYKTRTYYPTDMITIDDVTIYIYKPSSPDPYTGDIRFTPVKI